MSEKRRTLASVSGMLRKADIASASGRLLLQARIFMRIDGGGGPSASAGRDCNKAPTRCKRLSAPLSSARRLDLRPLDQLDDAGRGGAGRLIGGVAPEGLEA